MDNLYQTGQDDLKSENLSKYELANQIFKQAEKAHSDGMNLEAVKYYTEALSTLESSATEPNLAQLSLFHTKLGQALHEQSEFCRALIHLNNALDIAKKIYEDKQIETIMIMVSIGDVYTSQARYEDSHNILNEALHILILKNYEKRMVAVCYDSIGEAYLKQKSDEKALENFKAALEIKESVVGIDIAEMATSYLFMGRALINQLKYSEAYSQLHRALTLYKKTHKQNHPNIAECYHWIGNLYYWRKLYTQALHNYKEAYEIRRRCYGDDHLKVGYMLNNFGLVYASLMQYEKALEYFEQSLQNKIKWLGETHHEVARGYNNIGLVYMKKGEIEEAICCYKRAYEIYECNSHPDSTKTLNNLAIVLKKQGRFNDSFDLHQKSLKLKRMFNKEYHGDAAISFGNLGLIHDEVKNLNEAFGSFKKYLMISREFLKENRESFEKAYRLVARIDQTQARSSVAIDDLRI